MWIASQVNCRRHFTKKASLFWSITESPKKRYIQYQIVDLYRELVNKANEEKKEQIDVWVAFHYWTISYFSWKRLGCIWTISANYPMTPRSCIHAKRQTIMATSNRASNASTAQHPSYAMHSIFVHWVRPSYPSNHCPASKSILLNWLTISNICPLCYCKLLLLLSVIAPHLPLNINYSDAKHFCALYLILLVVNNRSRTYNRPALELLSRESLAHVVRQSWQRNHFASAVLSTSYQGWR